MRIFVELDLETERFVLMCDDGRMRPMPCGQRLFRAWPHPDIAFNHATAEEAEAAAGKLRTYLARVTPKPSKKQQRETAI